MTLIASVNIGKSIVMASDSLQINTNMDTGKQMPPTTVQKIFPFCKRFGVGISGRTVFNGIHIEQVIRSIEEQTEPPPNTPTEVAGIIMEEIRKILDPTPPEGFGSLYFQISGYHNQQPEIVALYIESDGEPKMRRYLTLGCTVGGGRGR